MHPSLVILAISAAVKASSFAASAVVTSAISPSGCSQNVLANHTTSAAVTVISDSQPQAPTPQAPTASSSSTLAPLLGQLGPVYQSPQNEANPYWNGWGGNIYNNRWNPGATAFNTTSARLLSKTCGIMYHRGVSATPVVEGDIAYYPTWSGMLVALNYTSCTPVWEYNVTGLI